MRHLVKGKKLSRNTSHRKATMQALSCHLIKNKAIQTTVAKAKELRRYVEPVITKSKEDTSHNRRQAFSFLQDKKAVSVLFDEIAPAVGDRPGGYTRVLKLGFRLGDSAEMALIELVDFSDYEPEEKSAKKKRTRRAGKSNKPTSSPETETSEKKEEAEEVDESDTQNAAVAEEQEEDEATEKTTAENSKKLEEEENKSGSDTSSDKEKS